ncbi:PIN domain-containing protein [Micromonospora sp. C95]|uniref:PIN domain-containing protein n=1 Tax=Micromonospora sp. C95 TaxID=2824882 RepID=UPI001B3624B0|nr:PIN domain-containing protein [Micromonospora sp. C95]MBQ1022969.1 DUF4935 domain-containing protein [Micromonospora sp. C95]
MLVVLDANALTADPRLTGSVWELLAARVSAGYDTVVVPAVAFIEVVANQRREAAVVRQVLDKHGPRLRKLGADDAASAFRGSLDRLAAGYETWLQERLATLGFVVDAMPDVDHETLVKWATQRRRPFNDNGGGYRDALVWSAVVARLARTHADAAFLVSGDKTFTADGGELHPDLATDLPQGGSVMVVPTAAKLAEVLFASLRGTTGPDVDPRLSAYVTGLDAASLVDWVADRLDDALARFDLSPEALALPRWSEGVAVEDTYVLELDRRAELAGGFSGSALVPFDARIEIGLSFELDALDADAAGLASSDHGGRDRVWVTLHKPVDVRLLVKFDGQHHLPTTLDVLSVQAPNDDPGHDEWVPPDHCHAQRRRA